MTKASAKFPGGLTASDYENIEQRVASEKVYKLADVQDRIERVAFDVVRFRDSEGLDKLWMIQDREGEQVLVAMYEEDEMKEAKASAWRAEHDKRGNVSVFYKSEPIVRLAMDKLGLPSEDASVVTRYLPEKLSTDKDLTRALLAELSAPDRETLFSKYPELKG